MVARATNNGLDTSSLADQYPRAFQLADGSSVELRVMSSDDRDAILGFVPEALLADFVVDRTGRSRDLVMMTFGVEGLTDQAGGPVRL